jgi:cell fate (sporulation/competence/biofilm development) regulator YmcA (YheA/YmcA/DUF963 family)
MSKLIKMIKDLNEIRTYLRDKDEIEKSISLTEIIKILKEGEKNG